MSVLWAKRGWMSGGTFVPHQLFTSGAQGAWYDPSDFSTLFQSASLTTPVTAVEQPVRLMLDKSKGPALGPELVTNGDFSDGATGWALTGGTATVTVTSGQLTVASTATAYVANSFATVIGRSYLYSVQIITQNNAAFNGIRKADDGTASVNPVTLRNGASDGAGVSAGFFVATASTTFIVIQANTGASITVDNISVRELPGNHATAPNDASRPVLRARYNQVLHSEALTIANGWTTPFISNATRADGAFTITGSEGYVYIQQTNITIANASHTVSFDAVCDQTITDVPFRLSFGGGSVSLLVNMVAGVSQRITLPAFTTTATDAQLGIDARDAIVPGGSNATGYTVTINRISILTAADAAATGNAYQRVGAATDYDTGPPWRPYLAFDGSDDSFGTSAIDFSGTDEVTLFAGVSKLSDAARGAIVELTASAAANNGAFLLAAPNAASATFAFESKGTALTDAVESSIAAPTTAVLTGIGDISGDVTTLRRNGTQRDSDTGDQGTGNYANAALFIGRRDNTSLPFNGRLYSLAVLGRTATAAEISAMEVWVAGKTGVTI